MARSDTTEGDDLAPEASRPTQSMSQPMSQSMSQSLAQSLAAPFRPLTRLWRRSITARVALSTVLLSALVVSGVGWLLLQQTRAGLLENRRTSILAEAAAQTAEAEDRLARASGSDLDASRQRTDLVSPMIELGNTRGYAVLLSGPTHTTAADEPGLGTVSIYTPGLDLDSVPARLRERFQTASPTAWTYTRIQVTSADAPIAEGPGIVVASQVKLPADGRTYTLYYLFPLEEENKTLALVTRALLTAAVVLLALVAAITWLVTRQVVTPIRLARRSAERLAAGTLTERLKVSGADDLARLAISFNQMAANLQQQIRQLEELSRVQRQFVSDVSHELRTPLTTVRMAGDMLHDARDDFDPPTARAAELLQKELDRFESLLADLLEISRFDAGAASLEVDDINLSDVVTRVVEMLAPLAAQRGSRLLVECEGRCLVEADVRRVERIVRNLVANAIDHAERGDVVIRVAANEEASAVWVRDFGVGLTEDATERVFDRFWRADPARARTSGGTGLGLSIALEDALLHGGRLQAWGRPGEGAAFLLTLPRHVQAEIQRPPLPLVPGREVGR